MGRGRTRKNSRCLRRDARLVGLLQAIQDPHERQHDPVNFPRKLLEFRLGILV